MSLYRFYIGTAAVHWSFHVFAAVAVTMGDQKVALEMDLGPQTAQPSTIPHVFVLLKPVATPPSKHKVCQ